MLCRLLTIIHEDLLVVGTTSIALCLNVSHHRDAVVMASTQYALRMTNYKPIIALEK
jgi:hypothetical protein